MSRNYCPRRRAVRIGPWFGTARAEARLWGLGYQRQDGGTDRGAARGRLVLTAHHEQTGKLIAVLAPAGRLCPEADPRFRKGRLIGHVQQRQKG